MAVVDKAGSINNLSSVDTPNSKVAQNVTDGGKLRFVRDTVEKAAADSNTSKYRLARVASNVVFDSISLENDAITGGTDYVLGFYDVPEVNSGAVIDADALMTTTSLASAGTKDGFAAVDRANKPKKAWELAGLTADPQKLFDVVLTANTAGTTAGTFTLTVKYSID